MDRLKINNDWLGVAIGIILPSACYGLAMVIKSLINNMVSTPFLLIICVGINFIPVLFYTEYNLNKTARGLVLVTIILGLLFFYYKLFVLKE
jgi:hypothetical protein